MHGLEDAQRRPTPLAADEGLPLRVETLDCLGSGPTAGVRAHQARPKPSEPQRCLSSRCGTAPNDADGRDDRDDAYDRDDGDDEVPVL